MSTYPPCWSMQSLQWFKVRNNKSFAKRVSVTHGIGKVKRSTDCLYDETVLEIRNMVKVILPKVSPSNKEKILRNLETELADNAPRSVFLVLNLDLRFLHAERLAVVLWRWTIHVGRTCLALRNQKPLPSVLASPRASKPFSRLSSRHETAEFQQLAIGRRSLANQGSSQKKYYVHWNDEA